MTHTYPLGMHAHTVLYLRVSNVNEAEGRALSSGMRVMGLALVIDDSPLFIRYRSMLRLQ